MRWDIFCKVIDNYGDIGVCWRLACALADRGEAVRLRVDDPAALGWMAPGGHPGVQVWPWPVQPTTDTPGEVVIEAFGCDIPPDFAAAMAHQGRPPLWINLEYLSAEPFVERVHLLPSPVMQGPAAGLRKFFFYPGFTPRTGGLLREPDLPGRQAAFDRQAWLAGHHIPWRGERLVSLFCYEPATLGVLLQQLATGPQPTRLLVTPGRARAAVEQHFLAQNGLCPAPDIQSSLSISYLPALTQQDFDHLLWSCDANFVRGEDSLVRALWAGKPCIWNIYPQDDDAHHHKLDAWLDRLQAPATLRQFHHRWNGLAAGPLPPLDLPAWQDCVLRLRTQLCGQDDLATQLLCWIDKNR